jgi:regulatory protein
MDNSSGFGSPRRRMTTRRRGGSGAGRGRPRTGSGNAEPPDGSRPPSPNDRQSPDADPESTARTIALRQLTAGPRTRSQLADVMAAKGVPDEAAAALLDRFDDVGLIDDEAFARAWVESRHAGRGLGRQVLRRELRNKGVDDEIITEAVSAVTDEDELESARRLVRRKASSMSGLDRQTRTRRLLGQLGRRGYGSSVALAAIRAEADVDAEVLGALGHDS